MSTLTEPRRTGAYLVSEAPGTRSREAIVINATAGKLEAGTVLAKITSANAGTTTPGTNTGDAVMGAVTVGNDATTGAYAVKVTKADAGASQPAEFTVTDPLGNTAAGVAGVKFEDFGISFTLTDGAGTTPGTDDKAAVNDSWSIAVTAGIGEWVAYDDDGTDDGRRAATGILYAAVDATTHDAPAVAHVRDCEVDAAELTGLDDNAVADLLALGIIVRGL
ncbi:MAG: head decoration protein [Thauera sp.]|jgi:hypothetical protein|nr:head decoration protein [Thauera sp.]